MRKFELRPFSMFQFLFFLLNIVFYILIVLFFFVLFYFDYIKHKICIIIWSVVQKIYLWLKLHEKVLCYLISPACLIFPLTAHQWKGIFSLAFFSTGSLSRSSISFRSKTSYIWFFGEKTWTSVLIYINWLN